MQNYSENESNRLSTHDKGPQMPGMNACSAWVLYQQAHLQMGHKIAIHARHVSLVTLVHIYIQAGLKYAALP